MTDNPVVPTYKEAKLGSKFHSLVSKLDELTLAKKQLETEEKQVRGEVTRMLAEKGEKSVMCDNLKVTFVSSNGPSHIDKLKLLQFGVSAKIIAKATVAGKPYETTVITRPKEKEGKSNEQE
jgi:hypothetical protein